MPEANKNINMTKRVVDLVSTSTCTVVVPVDQQVTQGEIPQNLIKVMEHKGWKQCMIVDQPTDN